MRNRNLAVCGAIQKNAPDLLREHSRVAQNSNVRAYRRGSFGAETVFNSRIFEPAVYRPKVTFEQGFYEAGNLLIFNGKISRNFVVARHYSEK